jgi:hypothetical protein
MLRSYNNIASTRSNFQIELEKGEREVGGEAIDSLKQNKNTCKNSVWNVAAD